MNILRVQSRSTSQGQLVSLHYLGRLPCWALLFVGWYAPNGWAQKAPQAVYWDPPVVVAGETSDIKIGGFDFTPDLDVTAHSPGVTVELTGPLGEHQLPPPPFWTGPRASVAALPLPREIPAKVTVPSEHPEGWIRWSVSNANGASTSAVVWVSRGPETMESRFRDRPQNLDVLPVAVSGRLSRLTEVDEYVIRPPAAGLVTLDLFARRLGADFHGVLSVTDSEGKQVGEASDTIGIDPQLTFLATAGTNYHVRLRDADFRGDRTYLYRLAISLGPQVRACLPAYAVRGITQEMKFRGIGLRTGALLEEEIIASVTAPSDPDLTTFPCTLSTFKGEVTASIPLSNHPELTWEQLAIRPDSNDRMLPSAPIGVTGNWPMNQQEQRVCWNVTADSLWKISAVSRGVGGQLDMQLAIYNAEGKLLAENDDVPRLTDSTVEVRTPTPGLYTAVVRGIPLTSAPWSQIYHLELQQVRPGFSLLVPEVVAVPLGGTAEITVQAVRSGGWAEEITLSAEGLPSGITMEGDWKIPKGRPSAKLKLTATGDANVAISQVQFLGRSLADGIEIVQTANVNLAGNLSPRSMQETVGHSGRLAVTMKPPFALNLVDRTRQRDVHRGTTCRADFEIVRDSGFEGEIILEMAAKQARYRRGITGPAVRVPGTAATAVYPCFMPEWLATDLTERMAVQGIAVVNDPQGRPRHLVQPADAQITMILEGALLKVSVAASEHTLLTGETLSLPVQVSRSAKLPLAVKVHIEAPAELQPYLQWQGCECDVEQTAGLVTLRVENIPEIVGDWPVTIVATALEDGKWLVRSECELQVTITAATNSTSASPAKKIIEGTSIR